MNTIPSESYNLLTHTLTKLSQYIYKNEYNPNKAKLQIKQSNKITKYFTKLTTHSTLPVNQGKQEREALQGRRETIYCNEKLFFHSSQE